MILLLILIAVAISIFDGFSISTLFASLFIIFIGSCSILKLKSSQRKEGLFIFAIICAVYLLTAYIFSRSFISGSFFLTSDPANYIKSISIRDYNFDIESLYLCYFDLTDSNYLYNILLHNACAFANRNLGGATECFMTLIQTLFGVLSINTLFRILCNYLDTSKSKKYTLRFAFFSLFLFYSSVILRDIIIAYFFLRALEILIGEYKIKGIVLLFFFMFLTWGIRLYSGLFFSAFILLYLYLHIRDMRFKKIFTFFFIAVGIVIIITVIESSRIIEQTFEEMNLYSEMTNDQAIARDGLFTMFYKLPNGIRQIAILFYSQMAPFPSFTVLLSVKTLPNLVMAITVIIYQLWWYFVFYTLIYYMITCGLLRNFSTKEKLLFIMAIIFIIANTSHPDIRRMMPVYPITYILYLKVKDSLASHFWIRSTRVVLSFCYVGLLLVYFIMKI